MGCCTSGSAEAKQRTPAPRAVAGAAAALPSLGAAEAATRPLEGTAVSEEDRRGQEVARDLAGKGFTVEQIVRFWLAHQEAGVLNERTMTWEVVRDVILPQTAAAQGCYMDSEFMVQHGGRHMAERLVSHAWSSPFVVTLKNIVMDAADLGAEDPLFAEPAWRGGTPKAGLDGLQVLQRFASQPEVLQRRYWLCIFAVNEHRSVCGDCWPCRNSEDWWTDPQRYFQADPCLVCGQPKQLPCRCGAAKTSVRDPRYEIDKYDYVVREMSGLVVSLDSDLRTMHRVWVVAEVGEAVRQVPVSFRLATGLGAGPAAQLQAGSPVVPPVADCEATSETDRRRILLKIANMKGGTESYDAFVQFMLDLRFGRCQRLAQLPEAALEVLPMLRHICMDASWHSEVRATAELLGQGRLFGRLQPRKLDVSFRACERLWDLSELGEALRTQWAAEDLRLNFYQCLRLADRPSEPTGVIGLAEVLRGLPQLRKLDLNLCKSQVSDEGAAALGRGLPSHLEQLTLVLQGTLVGDRGAAAVVAGLPGQLQELHLSLSNTQVGDEGVMGMANALPKDLKRLQLSLSGTQLGDVGAASLGGGLPAALEQFRLDIYQTRVSDRGAAALVQVLPSGLRRLNLGLPSMFGDVGQRLHGEAVRRLNPGAEVYVDHF